MKNFIVAFATLLLGCPTEEAPRAPAKGLKGAKYEEKAVFLSDYTAIQAAWNAIGESHHWPHATIFKAVFFCTYENSQDPAASARCGCVSTFMERHYTSDEIEELMYKANYVNGQVGKPSWPSEYLERKNKYWSQCTVTEYSLEK
jgi:hypothetical protein